MRPGRWRLAEPAGSISAMSERDAFGREADGEPPEVRAAHTSRGTGPPKWVLYMVAFDTLVVAIVAVILLT